MKKKSLMQDWTSPLFESTQDEKNQMMTTNVWVKQVCLDE